VCLLFGKSLKKLDLEAETKLSSDTSCVVTVVDGGKDSTIQLTHDLDQDTRLTLNSGVFHVAVWCGGGAWVM